MTVPMVIRKSYIPSLGTSVPPGSGDQRTAQPDLSKENVLTEIHMIRSSDPNRWQKALVVGLLVWVSISILSTCTRAQGPSTHKRVLILYWYNKDFPGNILFDHAFQATLNNHLVRPAEIYEEYFESNRFPGDKPTTTSMLVSAYFC